MNKALSKKSNKREPVLIQPMRHYIGQADKIHFKLYLKQKKTIHYTHVCVELHSCKTVQQGQDIAIYTIISLN